MSGLAALRLDPTSGLVCTTPTLAMSFIALLANLTGCLLIEVLLSLPPQRARLFLWGGIGFCGSLTTFSTWMLQLTQELQSGRALEALTTLLLEATQLRLTTLTRTPTLLRTTPPLPRLSTPRTQRAMPCAPVRPARGTAMRAPRTPPDRCCSRIAHTPTHSRL